MLQTLVKIVQAHLGQLPANAKSGCHAPLQPKMLAKSITLAAIQDHPDQMQQMRYQIKAIDELDMLMPSS